MVDTDGGASFERQFYRGASIVYPKMIKQCESIVSKALADEIILTCEDILKGKIDEKSINNIRKQIANGEINQPISELRPVPLALSYNVGWKKREGDRVYDSLSGHCF